MLSNLCRSVYIGFPTFHSEFLDKLSIRDELRRVAFNLEVVGHRTLVCGQHSEKVDETVFLEHGVDERLCLLADRVSRVDGGEVVEAEAVAVQQTRADVGRIADAASDEVGVAFEHIFVRFCCSKKKHNSTMSLC